MKILTVIPLKKGPLGQNLTYFSAQDISAGSLVNIPLRSKNTLGLVVSSRDASDIKADVKNMDFNLRKIIEIKKTSIFSPRLLESAIDTANYFLAGANNTITTLIPSIFREYYDEIAESYTKSISLEKKENDSVKSEKLIFQAPLEERISSYKTLIRSSFAEKKSVFIALPTEHDIRIFHQLLSRGIEQFTFEFHGGLSTKKNFLRIKDLLKTTHPVLVLATPPFLSLPRPDFKTIILERESSNSYRKIERPYIDLRVFVELFASRSRAKFILSDTLLSFTTISRKDTENLPLLYPLSFRINFDGDIKILERGKPIKDVLTKGEKKFKVLLDQSENEIRQYISKKKNVFIFALRKGLATQTICRDCGETLACATCSAPVVLYLSKDGNRRIFSCNRCKKAVDPETSCANCHSWNLMPLGIGTDTVYEEVKKVFGKEKIFQLDKETARNKKGAEEIIKGFENNEGAILIGTEMAFSYLKNKVPLSIIASFDSLWSIPNFAMGEKIIHILLSVLEKTATKLLIQTKNPNDSAILAVKNSNILSFVREELEERKKFSYPPYKRFIKVTHLGNKEEMQNARKILKEILKEYSPEIFSGFVAKLKSKYATNALIKVNPKSWSLPFLTPNYSIDQSLFGKLSSLPSSFEVTVDPEDLL
ncbi:hypothetical protein HYZ82_00555 [Candidatus Nomurabacteria bacterium]|nr:hypothetical protein [Candidatus Nomurabacteria bacterium]